MTRAFALGLIVGILVNQQLWVRRIRRTLAADDAAALPKPIPWPMSGTVTEHDGTSWTWTA